MSKITASLFCVLIVVIWLRASRSKVQTIDVQTTGAQRIRNLDQAIVILRQSSLVSRAVPNQRLTRVFNIENSFTTTLPEVQRLFLGTAQKLLRIGDAELNSWSRDIMKILYHRINRIIDDNERAPLVETVQVFVLRACLNIFFPELPPPSEADAVSITRNINTSWIDSKNPATLFNRIQDRSQMDLEYALKKVFQLDANPAHQICPDSNPLNVLLPVYEALWKVVLSGFLQFGYRTVHPDASIWPDQLMLFLKNPTRAAFDDPTNNTTIRHLVAETLRLYPPTKRIKRFQNNQLFDIDVEFLQRDPKTWGNDAEVFKPERWISISKVQECAFMPFGSGKFVCPSKRVVGPILIGIMVATLVECFGEVFDVVEEDGKIFRFGEGLLESGREAYKGLRLEMRNND